MESRTFIASSGQGGIVGPTLQDAVNVTTLSLYGERNDMGIVLVEDVKQSCSIRPPDDFQNVWQVDLFIVVGVL